MTEASNGIPPLQERVIENEDGTIIVKLVMPITMGKAEVHRLTVSAVKSKHMSLLPDELFNGDDVSLGLKDFLKIASAIVSPKGAAEELRGMADTTAVANATGRQLGKFLGIDELGAGLSVS